MKITMTETLQGAGISGVLVGSESPVTVLRPNETYEVSEDLGKWILDNQKGVSPDGVKAKAGKAQPQQTETSAQVEEKPAEEAKEGDKKAAKSGAK